MYISEKKTISKKRIINLSSKIINEFNSILNDNKKLINELKTVNFTNNNLKQIFFNFYDLFKILNRQNIKIDILYFYKLGKKLKNEKLKNEKIANYKLKKFNFESYIKFNLFLDYEYDFSEKEFEMIKKINFYFDKMLEINEIFILIKNEEKNNYINILKKKQKASILKNIKELNEKAEKIILEISILNISNKF